MKPDIDPYFFDGASDTAKTLVQFVADKCGVTVERLCARSREEDIVTPRHVAFYMLRTHTSLTLVAIGEFFGRDHGTVLHGFRSIKTRMEVDTRLRQMVDRLTAEFKRLHPQCQTA